MASRHSDWFDLPLAISAFGFRLVLAAGALGGMEALWLTRFAVSDAVVLAVAGSALAAIGMSALSSWLLPFIAALAVRWTVLLFGLGLAQALGLWLTTRVATAAVTAAARSWGQIVVLCLLGTAFLLTATELFRVVDAQRGRLALARGLRERAVAVRAGATAELRRVLAVRRAEPRANLDPLVAQAQTPQQLLTAEISELAAAARGAVAAAAEAVAPARVPWWDWGLASRVSLGNAGRGWALFLAAAIVPWLSLPVGQWASAWAGAVGTGALLGALWWLARTLLARRELPVGQALLVVAAGQSAFGMLGMQWLALAHPTATLEILVSSAALPALISVFVLLFQAVAARAMEVRDSLSSAKLELRESLTLVRQQNWLALRDLREAVSAPAAAVGLEHTGLAAAEALERVLDSTTPRKRVQSSEVAAELQSIRTAWLGSCEVSLDVESSAAEALAADAAAAECVFALLRSAVNVAVQEGFARSVLLSVRYRTGLLLIDVLDDGVGLLAHVERESSYSLFDELCFEWAIENTSRGTLLQATLPTAARH